MPISMSLVWFSLSYSFLSSLPSGVPWGLGNLVRGCIEPQQTPGQVQMKDRRLVRAKTNKIGTGSGKLALSLVVQECEVHPTEIRTSISPSSAVELNTSSALANYAIEAGNRRVELKRHKYYPSSGKPDSEKQKRFNKKDLT
uniref:Uncharacterized protein n=1 Tax=Timema monikensis TaxID=170555 RepID=A0A7R9E459_9NEOP|nr:unnamed protein product [Timema monikensis]